MFAVSLLDFLESCRHETCCANVSDQTTDVAARARHSRPEYVVPTDHVLSQAAIQQALTRDHDVTEPTVFQSNARQDTRGAAVDMLLLGMCNDTGAPQTCSNLSLDVCGNLLQWLDVLSAHADMLCALPASECTGSCVCHFTARTTPQMPVGAEPHDTRLASESMPAAAVITYGSSFGYVAAAWAGRPAHYLQHLQQNYTYRDSEVTMVVVGTALASMLVPIRVIVSHIDEL